MNRAVSHRNHQINGKTVFVTRSKFSATPPLAGLNKKDIPIADATPNDGILPDVSAKKASFAVPVLMKPRVLKRKVFNITETPPTSSTSLS